MKVTGFSFIRNALKYDYPIVEAIRSILPICDEFVVAVGASEDETLSLIKNIDTDKIKIIQTTWDDSLREGGKVLAEETNKAFQAIGADSGWAFYIQGDEVVHEQYLPAIRQAMTHHLNDQRIDGLLFDYLHFYGSYDYVGDSTKWYRKEVRIIRNNKNFYSYRDAQGFRKGDNQKLAVAPIDASVYHYGWVKDPRAMQAKQQDFNKLWHDDNWVKENIVSKDAFDYSEIDALRKFEGSHPKVMKARIAAKNWQFDYDLSINQYSTKERIKRWVEQKTGWRMGEYRNYTLMK